MSWFFRFVSVFEKYEIFLMKFLVYTRFRVDIFLFGGYIYLF